jgi:lipoyl(octanoyl) transferase
VAGGAATWRVVLGAGDALQPLSGVRNMALDAALFESVQAGAPPVLRLYLWRPACLSLGRNQPARALYDPALAAAEGVDIVRRPTGGLAVLHDEELTYAVIAPMRVIGRPRDAYRRINGWIVAALRSLGVPAEAATGDAAAPSWAGQGAAHPCFAQPAPGEVVAAGRKLAGSAQRSENGCLLQHGSILLDGDQNRVRRFERPRSPAPAAAADVPTAATTGTPTESPAAPVAATSVRALTGRKLAPQSLAEALVAVVAAGGTPLAPARIDPSERSRWLELASLYGSADWTWRR